MSTAYELAQIALVLLALTGSAFFSASEMALISSNRIRVRQRAKAGDPFARRAARLLKRREQLLVMFLVGQGALNVLAAAITTGLVDRWLGYGWVAPLISTAGLTLVVIVAAEIVPKVIGKNEAERLIMARARVLEFFHYLLLPLTGVIHLYIQTLLRLVGRGRRPFVTREELKVLVREAESKDERGRREKRMLESILGFRETVAREVMVPMNRIIALEQGTTCELWRAMVRRHGYTRLPIYEKRIDRVTGVLNIFDLLYDPQPKENVDEYVRPVLIVPDSKRIDHLLVEMQKTRNPLVVVVDEFGSCMGIVTVEDIVEEIVGEMEDEHEVGYRKIRRLAPRVFIVDGLTDIDDLNQELGLDLPKGRYDTAGGLILKRAGRIPRVGESFTLHGIRFEVLDSYPYGVRTLKVSLPEETRG
jgi:CBS domain containing-hemolysin-like protein